MQTTHDGTYLEVDDRPAVRFERIYAHPVDRVEAAVTEPDELKQWFPSPEEKTTAVLTWEPPHRFAFAWEDDELHFTLSEHEQGCRLELLNLLSNSGAGARNSAGWEICLGHLDRVVAGTWAPSPDDGSFEDFLDVLEKYKDQGVPDDGWLPDPPSEG